jgi:hypothetical protein
MKKLVIAFCAMLSLNAVSYAQNDAAAKGKSQGKEMKEQARKKEDQGKNDLGLSADEDAKYKAIRKAHQDAVKKVETDKSLTGDAKATQIAALKSKYEADVKGVMSSEKYTKWTEKRAKRDAKKGERGDKMKDHKEKENDDDKGEKDSDNKDKMKEGKEHKGKGHGKMKKDRMPESSSN